MGEWSMGDQVECPVSDLTGGISTWAGYQVRLGQAGARARGSVCGRSRAAALEARVGAGAGGPTLRRAPQLCPARAPQPATPRLQDYLDFLNYPLSARLKANPSRLQLKM